MEAVRELAHTADVGFEIEAASVGRLFELAARGLFDALGAAPSDRATWTETIAVGRPDLERLLVAWLRELLDIAVTREAVAIGASVSKVQGGGDGMRVDMGGNSTDGSGLFRIEGLAPLRNRCVAGPA